MWYKVTELNNKGFNKSQISVELGICRKTVRNYLSMNEREFKAFLDRSREASKKLTAYEGFVKDLLEQYAYLSAAQIEDRLKEHHADFPAVHSKTIYNFTQYIRDKYQLAKEKVQEPRVYEKLPESEYGAFAQVDFGQTYMLTKTAARKKVYFMAMVLCRSRHKFIYFQSSPFTSACAVAAHHKAFEYFEGQPHAIIYDQDRVFIRDENMGDLLLTQTFKEYVASCDFEAVFCRKSDPESKGKIENVIKYVKNNFCKGRIYSGDEELNQLALGWLERTANGTVHHGTKQIPHEVWKEEKNYLQPLRGTIISDPVECKRYKVRKDNTIHYKSNFYTLPRGTYKADMWVVVEEKNGQVKFYDEERKLLTTHSLCIDRGKTIRNTDHQRDKSRSIQEIKDNLLTLLGNSTAAILYTDTIHQKKGRYVRDNFNHMLKVGAGYSSDLLQKALETCLESSLYNAYQFEDVLKYQHKQQEKQHGLRVVSLNIDQKEKKDHSRLVPSTSSINTYSKFF